MDKDYKDVIYILIICLIAGVFFTTGFLTKDYLNKTNPDYKISFSQDVEKSNIINFNQVKDILESFYYKDVDENKMLEGAIKGMADSLDDVYTVYYTKEEMQKFMEVSTGDYVGIGVSVYMDEDDFLTVSDTFEDSPAHIAGMKTGDIIVKVDGEDVTNIKDSSQIISKIKGPKDTIVAITVFRPEVNNYVEFDVERKLIDLKYASSKMLNNEIGYLQIKQFGSDIYIEFIENYNNLIKQGAKAIIIDLRNNPGGSYTEAVDIIDAIVPKGLIVYTEDRKGRITKEQSDKNEINIPLAVLINGRSASASEIMSAAIKDYDKGTLIGTTTYGKGLVQDVIPLNDGSGIKVTVSTYYSPLGNNINGEGVTPDITVELDKKYFYYSPSYIPFEDDVQLQKGIEILKQKLNK